MRPPAHRPHPPPGPLPALLPQGRGPPVPRPETAAQPVPRHLPAGRPLRPSASLRTTRPANSEIGRAPCRENVCQSVVISVVASTVTNTTHTLKSTTLQYN